MILPEMYLHIKFRWMNSGRKRNAGCYELFFLVRRIEVTCEVYGLNCTYRT